MSKRSYSGPAIDSTYQYFHERPAGQDDAETVVYVTEPEDAGTETVENVPLSADDDEDDESKRPAVPGQTTIEEWSAL